MTLFNAPRGTYCKWDKLVFACLGNKQVIVAMEGTEIKRGEAPADITVEEITHDEFMIVVNKANHNNDWFSLALAKVCETIIAKDLVNS